MDERFLKAVEEVLENEKGYVNDPDDPGGETKFGISKRAYPNLDIANLTREEATAIYFRDWWERFRYGEIADLEVATELLDIALTNPKAAHMALQQAVKDTGGDWLDVDGYIGPITITAVNNHPNSKWLLDRFRLLAIQHYLGCKRKFLAGQVKRALN